MNTFVWTKELIENRIRNSLYEFDIDIPKKLNYIYPQNLFIFDGKTFIVEMYKTILNREPDKDGFRNNIRLLNKKIPKSYIIYSLIKSDEGRIQTKNKVIDNHLELIMKYYIYKIIKPFAIINKKLSFNIHKKIIDKYKSFIYKIK